MTSIRQAICDAIWEAKREGYPNAEAVQSVEFNGFCNQIEVTLRELDPWGGRYDEMDYAVTINASSILTAMLQQMVDEDTGHIPREDQ